MPIQALLSTTIRTSFPLGSDLLLLQILAFGALTNPRYETVWDLTNRVCDRYPQQRSRG